MRGLSNPDVASADLHALDRRRVGARKESNVCYSARLEFSIIEKAAVVQLNAVDQRMIRA